jgi:uncharacterized protein (TIGR02118 family)
VNEHRANLLEGSNISCHHDRVRCIPPAVNNRKAYPMAKLFAIYQQPKDPAAFDDYYFKTHVPLAKKIPGLKSYEVTRGDVMGMVGKHGVYLVAVLEFASMETIGAAMASPEGQATAADLANFAGAGVDVMMGETKLV